MIHDVQKKINKEMTLVISEKAREERNLPTGNHYVLYPVCIFCTYFSFEEKAEGA